jgi:hypothetical protein
MNMRRRRLSQFRDADPVGPKRQPWFSRNQAIPIAISILAIFVSAGISTLSLWLANFWHHPDLVVYLRFPEPKQLGTNTLDVNYFFSNMGNQTVLVENVVIDELWIKSDKPGYSGAGMEVDMCNDPNLWMPTSLTLVRLVPSVVWEEHKPIQPTVFGTNPQSPQSVLLAVVKPENLYIDGAEARTAATSVETGKMKAIGATFKTEPRPAEYNVVVVCPVVSFFDSKGQPVLAVCKGWQSGHLNSSADFLDTVLSPPAGTPPGRLLPVGSTGNCITHRMSGDAPSQ